MKEKLLGILAKPKGKLIAIDIDGCVCHGEWWGRKGEKEPVPDMEFIEYVNWLYNKGAHIVFYTSRNPKLYAETAAWLDKYGVMYHGIMMKRKPGASVYIDDKALNIDDIRRKK